MLELFPFSERLPPGDRVPFFVSLSVGLRVLPCHRVPSAGDVKTVRLPGRDLALSTIVSRGAFGPSPLRAIRLSEVAYK